MYASLVGYLRLLTGQEQQKCPSQSGFRAIQTQFSRIPVRHGSIAPVDAAKTAAHPKKGKYKRYTRTDDDKWWFNQLNQYEPYRAPTIYNSKSNAQFLNPLASLTG